MKKNNSNRLHFFISLVLTIIYLFLYVEMAIAQTIKPKFTNMDAIIILIVLGVFYCIFIIPLFFYLKTLKTTLLSISEDNRKMRPRSVWLNLIPIFAFFWHIYTVVKVRDSLISELKSKKHENPGDGGIVIGLTITVFQVLSVILDKPIKIFAVVSLIICWIVYWSKINNYKTLLKNIADGTDLSKNIGFELTENDSSSNTEKHIIKIFNELSQKRKDLCFDGIIIKIEDEYKYKESLIREVIEKYKNTKISGKVAEEENQKSGPEKNTLLYKTSIESSNKISPTICPNNFIEPLKQIINTSAELLQANSARQFDVNMGLSDIKRNCEEALLALQKGIDIEGTPITSTEVGKGLRLLWTNFGIGWIDIVKSKMKASEHMALKRILNEIETISQELENSNTA